MRSRNKIFSNLGIGPFIDLVFASCSMTAVGTREDIELDEIELEVDEPYLAGTIKVSPVERVRTGARVGFRVDAKGAKEEDKNRKSRNIEIYAQAFDEEFDEDYDGYGFGVGISGAPIINKINEEIDLILPVRLGLYYFDGDADM